MRIGMLAPISWRVPPKHYGPWELFVALLTEGLVREGIDVTLFATGDSQTSARLVGTAPRGYSEDPSLDAKVWECMHIASCFERSDEFDLIHNSFDFLPLSYSKLVKTPVLTTIHGFSSEKLVEVYRRYNGNTHYVSISDADRHPDLAYAATIYHGIDMQSFDLCEEPGEYLLFFGRIHPDKGTADAIRLAKAVNKPLVIAGIIQDEAYYESAVKPEIDGDHIQYIGPVGHVQRNEVLGKAAVLLHLIHFEEPFGLSVVESMACGTPVVAYRRGSMPELINDKNGFLVETEAEAIDAVKRAPGLDRCQVRASVIERFAQERMVSQYIRVYEKILNHHKP